MRVHCIPVDILIRELTLEVLEDLTICPPQETGYPSPEPEEEPLIFPLELTPPSGPPLLIPVCETPPPSVPSSPSDEDDQMPLLMPFEDDGGPGSDLRVSPPIFDLSDDEEDAVDSAIEFDCTESPPGGSSPVHSPFHLDFPMVPGQDCASCLHVYAREGDPICSLCYLRIACSGKWEFRSEGRGP